MTRTSTQSFPKAPYGDIFGSIVGADPNHSILKILLQKLATNKGTSDDVHITSENLEGTQ